MSDLNFDDFFEEIKANDIWDTGLENDFHTGLWFNNLNDIRSQTKKKFSFIKKHFPTIIGCICGVLMICFIFFSFFHLISKIYDSSNVENKQYIERKVDNYESPSVY